jgi:hypothetical protein
MGLFPGLGILILMGPQGLRAMRQLCIRDVRVLVAGFLLFYSAFLFSSRLPGGGITFFAAAKKVIKESSFSTTPAAHSR